MLYIPVIGVFVAESKMKAGNAPEQPQIPSGSNKPQIEPDHALPKRPVTLAKDEPATKLMASSRFRTALVSNNKFNQIGFEIDRALSGLHVSVLEFDCSLGDA